MLEGRVFVVAGGGHGIGKATAIHLGELGATVVVNDLGTDLSGQGESRAPADEVADEVELAGGEAISHFGDIASLEYTEELVQDTVEEYGRLDGAVNFAGVLADAMSYKMTGEQWDKVIRVHLRGHFALLRAVAAHWREVAGPDGDEIERQRSFVGVSSGAAGTPNFGQLNYASAKAGILGLIRTAAVELDRLNIRANAVWPSAYTRMITDMPEDAQPDETEVPDPEDIAPVVAYLLSDHAEGITGCTIRAAGDTVGLVSNPEVQRLGYKDDGWSVTDLSEKFREEVGQDWDLHRSDPPI